MNNYQKKICLLGEFAVGKTSLIRRFIEGIFDDKYLTTIGVVVSRKSIAFPQVNVNLLVWDLAGGRDFSQTNYLAGVTGALIVCDLTRPSTLAAYHTYSRQVLQVNAKAQLILLANKSDLSSQREISEEELVAVSNEIGAPYLLTSAKTGDMVEFAFTELARKILNSPS